MRKGKCPFPFAVPWAELLRSSEAVPQKLWFNNSKYTQQQQQQPKGNSDVQESKDCSAVTQALAAPQKTWIQFPARRWRLATINNFSSKELDARFCTPQVLGPHVIFRHIFWLSTHSHKLNQFRRKLIMTFIGQIMQALHKHLLGNNKMKWKRITQLYTCINVAEGKEEGEEKTKSTRLKRRDRWMNEVTCPWRKLRQEAGDVS